MITKKQIQMAYEAEAMTQGLRELETWINICERSGTIVMSMKLYLDTDTDGFVHAMEQKDCKF